MRLLYVHERFGAMAGAEANILVTARQLRQRGHTIGIIHGLPTGKGEESWRQIFTECFPLGARKQEEAVRSAVNSFRPDVVYVHKMADLRVIETLIQTGLPLARMIHDHDIYCMRSYKYYYFSRRICRRPASPFCLFPCGAFVARNRGGGFPLKFVSYRQKQREIQLNQQFHRLAVVARYTREELLRNGFDDRKIEIHPPVPPPGDPLPHGALGDRNLILYAGQIIRGKGVDLLLRSLARLRLPFESNILGEGTHKPACERLAAKLRLQDRVHFMGFVPQEQLKEYYRECAVVAISSVWPEPFATIGLEAMRYAIPVVAFDAGGISDWLVHNYNGFLVPWRDCDIFAQRLEQLLANRALARQMGENGRCLASVRFNFESYIHDLEAMFARAIGEAQRRV